MSNQLKTLDGFLEYHKTKQDQSPTHTKIGDHTIGVYGASYCIPHEDMESFYKLYHKDVFQNNKLAYITEVQLSEKGPIVIDIDERFPLHINKRQHDDEQILDVINLYIEKLLEIVKTRDFEIPIYVLEKDEVNIIPDKHVKDGVHIILSVSIPHAAKEILRKSVINDLSNIFPEDYPLTNTFEELLDAGVCNGKINWQLFGSRKPGNQGYKLKKIYKAIIKDGELNEYEETLIKNKINYLNILPKISARNLDIDDLELIDSIKEEIENLKKAALVRKKPRVNVVNATFNDILECQNLFPEIKSKGQCEKIMNYILKYAKDNDNYNIKYAYDLTMILNGEYYNPYDNWLKVGWTLKKISPLLYPCWLLFSSKSEKFDWEFHDCYDEWYNRSKYDESRAPTIGSLKYWAKKCDIGKVTEIHEQNIKFYLYKTLSSCTEYDIAELVHALYQDDYKCTNISKKCWYEFKNGRWRDIDSGTSLRQALSHRIAKLYHKEVQEALMNAEDINVEDDKKEKNMEAARLAEMALKLKTTKWKQNIMRECCELFYDGKFINKLDTNMDLMCFNNGVIDFGKKKFRQGEPSDHLSLCTNTDYVELDPDNEDHIRIKKEITEFMQQLFPDKNVNKYMWEHLASILKGGNKNQTFNIYTGSGRNGKSKLVTLMGMVLGDYKGSVPLTLITRERTSIGSVSPEVAQLAGVRYAVMQEPSKATKLNEGPMKELVGEDPIQCRGLYQDAKVFIPQFKLVVCTNHLFDITSNDDGTWRRIRVCDFISKFIDNPSDDPNAYEFQIDRDIDKKFEEWAPIFTAMLVEKVFETDGYVQDCPEVMAASQKYKDQQDRLSGFIKERIQRHAAGVIKKTDVRQEFEDWYVELYSGKVPSGKELYDYLSKVLGAPSRKGWHGWSLCHSYDMVDDTDIVPNNILLKSSNSKSGKGKCKDGSDGKDEHGSDGKDESGSGNNIQLNISEESEQESDEETKDGD